MKKLFLLLTTLMFLFFSCKKENSQAPKTPDTLRGRINELSYGISWSDEIDPEGLPKLEKKDLFLQLPLTLCVLPETEAVYPEYDDFGELNLSDVPYSLVKFVDSFCRESVCVAVDKRDIKPDILDSSYPFLEMVLEDELSSLHEVKSYLVAKPEFYDGVYQVPVRLFGNDKHTDILMFVNNINDTYQIDQVYFGEPQK